MKRQTKGFAIFFILAIGAVSMFLFMTASETKKINDSPQEKTSPPTVTKPIARHSQVPKTEEIQLANIQEDDDPIGTIFLEGQTVDIDGNAIGNATVFLNSVPPRSTTSEDDGSFSFTHLIPKRYSVSAQTDSLYGRPMIVHLTTQSDPVLVRMFQGSTIEITVLDKNEKPIQNASVAEKDSMRPVTVTNAEGKVTMTNIQPGPSTFYAFAPGYAKAYTLVLVPQHTTVTTVVAHPKIVLQKGFQVVGYVVDKNGQGIEGATVIAHKSSAIFHFKNAKEDGVSSDKNGKFILQAEESGSIQMEAHHTKYAPSFSERLEVSNTAKQEITLRMEDATSISGQVVTSEKIAAAWATVLIISGDTQQTLIRRKTIADQDGHFKITSLSETSNLTLIASTPEASSEEIQVKLPQNTDKRTIELVLTVKGSISGIVVDENGEPVAEVQVKAVPDLFSGASMDLLRHRGPSLTISGADGSFTFKGLPESNYRVALNEKYNSGFRQGIPSKTGDTQVRLVLNSPGSIVGKIQASDGSIPPIATISLGGNYTTPVAHGDFQLSDIPAGEYELTVKGVGFAKTFVSHVKVNTGKETDVSTIIVKKGRSVKGRVLDKTGTPVSNAQIIVAKQLISDGKNLQPKEVELATITANTQSDENGYYEIQGMGESEQVIVADHLQQGRSTAKVIPKGKENIEMDIQLLAVGSLKGKILMNGEGKSNLPVLITSAQGNGRHMIVVNSDEQGNFYAERVVVGSNKVSAIIGEGVGSSMTAMKTIIKANEEVELNLTVEEGNITLHVEIVGLNEAKIDVAQVFLFQGVVNINNGGQLNKLFLSESANAKMAFAVDGKNASFEKIMPGNYSVCILPINGDMSNPAFAARLQRNVEQLEVHCQRYQVPQSPEQQTYKGIVPPMQPFPDPDPV